MEECGCWLAFHGLLSYLFHMTQDHLLRDSTTHTELGLGPPT